MKLHNWIDILHVICVSDHWAPSSLALSDWAAIKHNSWVKFYNYAIKIRMEIFHCLNRNQFKVIALEVDFFSP